MMWIILFTNVILLFRNVILQTKTIILLSTKIISLAKIIQNKITLKSTLHSLTFNFAPVLFTNRKSDFLQCILHFSAHVSLLLPPWESEADESFDKAKFLVFQDIWPLEKTLKPFISKWPRASYYHGVLAATDIV